MTHLLRTNCDSIALCLFVGTLYGRVDEVCYEMMGTSCGMVGFSWNK